MVESSCPLSEEQVRVVEAYFLAGKKRGRLVPKYALYLLDEDEEEEEGGGGRVAREKHHFGSKNKLGVAIPGVGANVVDAKRLILKTTVSRSVFCFTRRLKKKVAAGQCLKKSGARKVSREIDRNGGDIASGKNCKPIRKCKRKLLHR